MRIAIGADLLDGERCGMQIALKNMLDGLSRSGHSRDIHLIHAKPHRDQTFNLFGDVLVAGGTIPGAGLYWSQLAVPHKMRRLPVDVLWWPCQILPPIRCPVPRVISVWDLAPMSFNDENWNRLSVTVKYHWILSLALKKAAHVICHSRAIADEVIRRFRLPAKQISVVYPGLSEPFRKAMHNRLPVDPNGHILYVGTCSPRKNVKLLIDAYQRLATGGVQNRLALVIGGPERAKAELVEYARRIGIPVDRLLLPDPKDVEELIDAYRQAAVFAFPSLYEGFGLPLIEASALGLPVVALNRSTMPEVLGQTGVRVNDPSPSSFAEGIRAGLMMARERGEEVSEIARAQAARYKWDEAVESILSILSQAAGRVRQ